MLNAETEVEPKAVKSRAAAIILMIFCMGNRSLFSIVWGIDLQAYLYFPYWEILGSMLTISEIEENTSLVSCFCLRARA